MSDVVVRIAPPAGTITPANLYAERDSRTLWLGVDVSVDVTGAVLIADIEATAQALAEVTQAISDTLADANAYTDSKVTTSGIIVDRFYSSGSATWNKPAGLKYLDVWVQGGGGGGGGANASAGCVMSGSGGGGGGAARRLYVPSQLRTTESITVGAGGAGGTGTVGANGGTGDASSFTSIPGTLIANGGSGGINTGNNNDAEVRVGGRGGTDAAAATESWQGCPGHNGLKFASPPYQGIGGAGGAAGTGSGGSRAAGSAGIVGDSGHRGSGGNGGLSMNGGGGSGGGAGGAGYVMVREYF